MDLSVVVPVYNEAGSIETLVRDLERELVPLFDRVEVIVVDDASTDETPAILDRLADERPWLDVQRAERNAGHGACGDAGLERAQRRVDLPDRLRRPVRRRRVPAALGARRDDARPRARRPGAAATTPTHRLAPHARRPARRVAPRGPSDPGRRTRRSGCSAARLWAELEPLIDPDTLAPNILVTLGAAVRGGGSSSVPGDPSAARGRHVDLRALRLVRFSLRGLGQLVAFRYRLARAPARRGAPPEATGCSAPAGTLSVAAGGAARRACGRGPRRGGARPSRSRRSPCSGSVCGWCSSARSRSTTTRACTPGSRGSSSTGDGYSYDPVYHGPVQFYVIALADLLFGVGDYVAAVPVAVVGHDRDLPAVLPAPAARHGRGAHRVASRSASRPSWLYFSRFAA